MSGARRQHFGWFLARGFGPHGWGHPYLDWDYVWTRPGLYQQSARELEQAGFDFVLIDCEHGPADLIPLRQHIAAARLHGVGDMKRYNTRMAAVEFTIEHDDGQSVRSLEKADVILLIGDGMDDSMITATRNYAVGAAGRLVLDGLPATGPVGRPTEPAPGPADCAGGHAA